MKQHPDFNLLEYAKHFKTSATAISRTLKKLKITRKKTCSYKERDEAKRALVLEQIKSYAPEDLVYVDESGIDSYCYRWHGWAPSCERVHRAISGKHFARESLIAAKCDRKIFALLRYQGTCNTLLFDA